MSTSLQSVVQVLLDAYENAEPCGPVRDLMSDATIESAYQVQSLMVEHWLAAGRRPVGRKIGLTSAGVQAQLGVDQPDFGALFADMCRADGATISTHELLQPRIEAEIAFVLKSDLAESQPTPSEVIDAIDYALPALEIVDSRVANWDISILDTIADNASSGLFVLGSSPKKISELDLRLCGMVTSRHQEPVSVGAGIACLGNPINAVAWLADFLVTQDAPLRAGEVVLSGALGPMIDANPGDVFEARISGLGSVRVNFESEEQ